MGSRGYLTVPEKGTIISELAKVKVLYKYITFLADITAAPDAVNAIADI